MPFAIAGPSVLVVDDAGLDLWVPGLLLRPHGVKVVECSQEWRAISAMLESNIDLMLLNPYCRSMDATSLLNWMHNLSHKKPKLVCFYVAKDQYLNMHGLSSQALVYKPLKTADGLMKLLKMS
jgi:response regulator RpfG family c-di-GMP phosphodiesterase